MDVTSWVVVSALLITDTELNAFAAPANLHVEVVPCPLAGIPVSGRTGSLLCASRLPNYYRGEVSGVTGAQLVPGPA